MILKISEIKIGQRVRDEYGDMEELAKSIQEHGLLPVSYTHLSSIIFACFSISFFKDNFISSI